MRVLMVANTYLPVRNGVTVSLAGWVSGLRELGCDVTVWTLASSDPGLPGVFAAPAFGSMATGYPYPLTIAPPPGVRGQCYDVVHAHQPVVLGPPAARFARSIGAAFVTTAHSEYLGYIDDYTPAFSRRILKAAGGVVMRGFFERADLILAPSSHVARIVAEWSPATPVEPSVYPVDARTLRPVPRADARRTLGIGADTPLALYAGRVAPEKGLDDLVAEFEAARDMAPGAILAIAGSGPWCDHLASAVERLGLTDTVRFLGMIPSEELGTWYSAADIHVSASPTEVGPLTVLEAAVCATPSVGYAVPGFEDRIAHEVTGLLAPRQSGALAAAMARLLCDRDAAARMGVAAQERSEANAPLLAARAMLDSYERARAARR